MDSKQQQQTQTEQLIEKMLDFLESSSEEEEDCGKFSSNGIQDEHTTAIEEESSDKATKVTTKTSKEIEKKTKKSIAKELRKINQQYPIWNIKEIVHSNKKSISLPQSPTYSDEPIWRQSSLSILNKSMEISQAGVTQDDDDCSESNGKRYTNVEKNCRRSGNSAYVQEVRKAIYGDTRGHPANGSAEYYQAAQNYAVYGKDFMDFPQDMQTIFGDQVLAAGDKGNCGNSLYTISNQGPGLLAGCNLNEGLPHQSVNSCGIAPTSSSPPIGTTPTASVAAVAASTAAYYQLCNGIQSQARSASTMYGMVLGNKMTYVAAVPTTAPQLVYNQHTSQATTNFISNSLANAALATSPAILYSNPMLTTTTQQYLNAFFKETQYLSTAAASAGGANSTQQANASNGIYERLVYAQMLQQQLYHQSQQAAAVAAMLQHKQRSNLAARLATTATNGTTINDQHSTSMGGGLSSKSTTGNINHFGRQTTMAPDLPVLKQQSTSSANHTTIVANGGEESSKINKE